MPVLVEQDDLRGDLHMHTVLSDGRNTAEEMALACRDRGLEYIAITDHSASHGFGNDVSPDELRRQIERIRELNERIEGIEILVGTESNIGVDGSPDYDDDLLAELDWVIASVHTSFGMDATTMTDRIVAAIEHPLIDAIGHPTGRKIERRAPYGVEMDRRRRGRRAHGHDDRDQLGAGPPRPQRRARARGGAGGRADPRELGRARRRHARHHALGDRDRATRVADRRRRGEHAAVGGVRAAAQARAGR